MLIYIGYP